MQRPATETRPEFTNADLIPFRDPELLALQLRLVSAFGSSKLVECRAKIFVGRQ